MKHFVAYNKVAEWGDYPEGRRKFRHWSKRPKRYLESTIGQTIWVISGEKINGEMVYKLVGRYTPSHIESDQEGWLVVGNGSQFKPRIELNRLSWFRDLLNEQGQFGFGINQIKSGDVIRELEKLGHEDFRLPDEVGINEKHFEGLKKQITVNAYERNPKARVACIAYYGAHCTVCGFDFEKYYGEIGKGYIHIHHLKPISEIGKRYEVDPVKDLRPVCPNCHAMLHAKEPPYMPEELRELIKNAKL